MRYSGKQVVQVYGLTIEKLKLLTDAEFAELEFPRTDFCRLRAAYIGSFTMGFGVV